MFRSSLAHFASPLVCAIALLDRVSLQVLLLDANEVALP